MDIPERRLSTAEVQELSLPLQNDLIAIFGVIGDAVDRLLDKAVREGWTPEVLIDEIVRLIDGDNRAPETVAMTKVEELKVNKSRLQTLRVLEKSLETLAVMKAGKPVGTISERKDGTYKKVGEGKWERQPNGVSQEKPSGEKVKLTTLNPTGSIFVNHKPEDIMNMELGENITTLAETSERDPDEKIIIYRGISTGKGSIGPGDFVTTNKQLAQDYAGTGTVVSETVRAGDILDDKDEPMGEEYIYYPKSKSENK